uniref:Putative esterase n=1 Tax=uncultured microorganism TaxID=358574 RepID=D0VYN9_9ZZZZ|nr:putative esterase [uncultured microorganism]
MHMEPTCHAPIVLVHGLLGFDRICLGKYELKNYFPGIEACLGSAGRQVRLARLSRTRGVAARALELRRFIRREFPGQRVHVFAHSMGGLDARYMISKLDMADHVLSLTTLGTPHRGCSFADWGIRELGWFLRPTLRLLNISRDAFLDLTTDACRRFNEETPNAPGVRYRSIAGDCDRSAIGPFWQLSWNIVHDREGPNDGVVSVNSARHGESLDVWRADHMNLVNWSSRISKGRDFARKYVHLANQID